MLYRYLLILIACTAVLIGIQLPNFVDQFAKRVDAHLIEAETGLRGFQQVADAQFGGSLDAMIQHHEQSTDPSFRDEAQPIHSLWQRAQLLRAQHAGMAAALPRRLWFIATRADRQLLTETYANYSAAVPLNRDAVYCGAAAVVAILLMVEVLAALLRGLGRLLFGLGRNDRRLTRF